MNDHSLGTWLKHGNDPTINKIGETLKQLIVGSRISIRWKGNGDQRNESDNVSFPEVYIETDDRLFACINWSADFKAWHGRVIRGKSVQLNRWFPPKGKGGCEAEPDYSRCCTDACFAVVSEIMEQEGSEFYKRLELKHRKKQLQLLTEAIEAEVNDSGNYNFLVQWLAFIKKHPIAE